jgi:hypothetical protein
MAEGVTTIEVKSGYGLELAPSGACWRWRASSVAAAGLSIKKTFLGLHALPPEFAANRQAFVDEVAALARVAGRGRDWWMRSMRFARTSRSPWPKPSACCARRSGWALPAHVHAGQLSDMGAAELAAKWGALSADHLEYLSGRRRTRPWQRRGHGRGAAALRLFHAAADDAAAGGVAARRRRRGGRSPSPPTAIRGVRPAPRFCSRSTWPAQLVRISDSGGGAS